MSQVKFALRNRIPRHIGAKVNAIGHQGRPTPVSLFNE